MEKRQELVEVVDREEEEQGLAVTMEEEEEWVIPVHVGGLQRP